MDVCADLLHTLDLPFLSDNESESLSCLISHEELRKALNTKKDKSLGWDGISPVLYFTFCKIHDKPLLEMINTAIDKGAFNSSNSYNYSPNRNQIKIPRNGVITDLSPFWMEMLNYALKHLQASWRNITQNLPRDYTSCTTALCVLQHVYYTRLLHYIYTVCPCVNGPLEPQN